MRQLPIIKHPNVLVGANQADDAGVYRLDRSRALVQTVDFFTPIVDDPFLYGQIAAANSLSDVYAMGGRPLTALNILGVPTDSVSPDVIAKILLGGALKTKEAKCVIVGGHTIRNAEPIYGLSVTGLVSPHRMLTNSAARPGDWLVLTKPLGTGIITTGIKREISSPSLVRRAINIMCQLNSVGADLAENRLVQSAVDVTGFGLLGHLAPICRQSHLGAEVFVPDLPLISEEIFALLEQDCVPGGTRQNLADAESFTDWGSATAPQKFLLTDAQTSGGLLLCVAPRRLDAVMTVLNRHRTPCAVVIGKMIRSTKAQICVRT